MVDLTHMMKPKGKTILVTGGASGLGKAIVEKLMVDGNKVWIHDQAFGDDVRAPGKIDLEQLDILVNCAGVNGIDFLENVTDDLWDRVMDTNAKGIYKMSQACLPLLIESKGTILNIVSNAATVPMTSSIAYNASKGAAKIMTAQMARELTRRHGITVFSISPNKLKGTGMSEQIDAEVVRTRGWTPEEATRYQLAGLLTGEETPPERVAEFAAWLLADKERHRFLTGCDIPYGV